MLQPTIGTRDHDNYTGQGSKTASAHGCISQRSLSFVRTQHAMQQTPSIKLSAPCINHAPTNTPNAASIPRSTNLDRACQTMRGATDALIFSFSACHGSWMRCGGESLLGNGLKVGPNSSQKKRADPVDSLGHQPRVSMACRFVFGGDLGVQTQSIGSSSTPLQQTLPRVFLFSFPSFFFFYISNILKDFFFGLSKSFCQLTPKKKV